VDWEKQCIYVRRKYVYGNYGDPKSRASKAPVPLHPILAAHLQIWRSETPYAKATDLIFPSLRLKGKKPPAANMLVSDHLRPAAKKAGIEAPPRAFGFHTFRRTLASVLVGNHVDPKVVQEVLRHQGIGPTLELYAKTITANKLEAQGMFLNMLLAPKTEEQPQIAPEPHIADLPLATEVLQ
jgi:integrase